VILVASSNGRRANHGQKDPEAEQRQSFSSTSPKGSGWNLIESQELKMESQKQVCTNCAPDF
jgi:hypothetical protein